MGVLLQRCSNRLTDAELEQVTYVDQAIAAGGVARGFSSDPHSTRQLFSSACPRCSRPIDALSPRCSFCSAEVVVCFRMLRLCDLRHAALCTFCSAVDSSDAAAINSVRPANGGQPR